MLSGLTVSTSAVLRRIERVRVSISSQPVLPSLNDR